METAGKPHDPHDGPEHHVHQPTEEPAHKNTSALSGNSDIYHTNYCLAFSKNLKVNILNRVFAWNNTNNLQNIIISNRKLHYFWLLPLADYLYSFKQKLLLTFLFFPENKKSRISFLI